MFFILACAAALFLSDKAALRRRRSFILVMIAYCSESSAKALQETDGDCNTSCSRRSLVAHSSKLFSRSSSSRFSSASFSSRSFSFSRLARALASKPAFISFCFFFSFSASSSSCINGKFRAASLLINVKRTSASGTSMRGNEGSS